MVLHLHVTGEYVPTCNAASLTKLMKKKHCIHHSSALHFYI